MFLIVSDYLITEGIFWMTSKEDKLLSWLILSRSFASPALPHHFGRRKTWSDPEDVWCALIWCDDWLQTFHLFVVTKMFDPVKPTGSRQWDEPLHCGVTLPVGTLQPVEPAIKTQSQWFCVFRHTNSKQLLTWSPMMHLCGQCSRCLSCCHKCPL